MTKYYSPSTKGFYSEDIHGEEIPEDAVEISEEKWRFLLAGNARGRVIDHDESGSPLLRDLNDEELGVSRRQARDTLLGETDWIVNRHRDELDAGDKTTLSTEQFRALQLWRRALRDMTEDPNFPRVQLPARPDGV